MAPQVTPQSTHYALVIDAGSSGSRLQIYSWRDPDLERAEIVADVKETVWGRRGGRKWWWPPGYKGKGKEREGELERRALRRLVRVGKGVEGEAWVKRVEPGISSTKPSEISSYLSPMLRHAMDQIPPSLHSTTPIYLYATAGMRLLPQKEQDALLEATCSNLRRNYPFKVGESSTAGPCGEHIRVISGEEEGLWGWVAVNYLMDGFGHAPPYETTTAEASSSTHLLPLAPLADPPAESSQESVTPVDVAHHSPTFGFLDMGGASTQLAFSPSAVELAKSGFPEADLREVSLRLLSGEVVDWPVFSASWLGFGTNRVRERYTEALLSRAADSTDTSTPIPDPCLPVGLKVASGGGPDFVGTGSFGTCLTELKPLLDHDMECPTEHCLFAGVPTPHIDFERADQRGFIGVSEYWYTASQVLGLGGVWDWGEWEKGMAEFCARDWDAIQKQVEEEKGWRGSALELSRLQTQCFKGAWISNVLHDGIGIPRLFDKGGNDTLTGGEIGDTNAEANRRARQKGLFQSMDEINETAISWTLGKMVIEASKAVQPRSPAKEVFWKEHLPFAPLSRFGQQLTHAGVNPLWVYGLFVLGMILCCFSGIRRRLGLGRGGRKGRKGGVSNGPLSPSAKPWNWVMPWSQPPEYSIEDGPIDISSSPKPVARPVLSRLRILALRMGHTLRRNLPFGKHYSPLPMSALDSGRRSPLSRAMSMPLSNSLSGTAINSYSQPPSPKRPDTGSGFFTPGYSSTLALPRSGGVTPSVDPFAQASASASSVQVSPAPTPLTSSPPRMKTARSPRPPRSNPNMPDGGVPSSGWNDPPSSMLGLPGGSNGGSKSPNATYGMGLPAHRYPDKSDTGVLTPPATEGVTMSRQSSRVNLSEMGLAQRSSRAGTPHGDYEDGM